MKLHVNFVYPILMIVLFTLLNLQCCNARNLGNIAEVADNIKANSTNQQNATVVAESSDKQNNTALIQSKSPKTSSPVSNTALTHILRKKRETEPVMPFDYDTMHLGCDMDQGGLINIIAAFPNHCIWVWNNRFVHEGYYRVFKTYQLEAFFFGQYYERLRRFEVDPHTWDYSSIGKW
ncbi:uncharacterized protein LOC132792352 [Drosophila nasuta]|uniref:uncharacterized protein LOC132792352 n=1 Tax=Drosophila nasuta TaxID=42062 RepID=UPI00295E4298|nr:uncharacterized protein LOC132792352 [Drosophila nasuta]